MKINWKKILLGISEEKLEPYFHLDPADENKIVQIKTALAAAETDQALDVLATLPLSSIEPLVIPLSGRYRQLEAEQIRGVLSREEYIVGINRINADILSLVNRLEKSFTADQIILEGKANLRNIYQQRLQDKLADRHPINIQCAYSITGTDWDRAQIVYDKIVLKQQEVSNRLERIFDEHRGRLLIIGDPGAGKTSLLLQLAIALLQRRENRVPLILNLATWNHTYKNFEHWLLETVPRAASVSKAFGKTLVMEDRLLPLFDGLDEVAPEYRRTCMEAIAHYGQVAEHQYVICSRTIEYAEIGEAPVYAQIELQPLKLEQIQAELENSHQPEAKFLLHAIQHDPLLAEVVRNPFYFNTTQLLLASMKSYSSLRVQANTTEELQKALVEKFAAKQLNTTVKRAFPAEKSRKWLGFMATKMEENGVVVFELTDLNLGWVKNKFLYFTLGFIYFLFSVYLLNFSTRPDTLFRGLLAAVLIYLFWFIVVAKRFIVPSSQVWQSQIFYTHLTSKVGIILCTLLIIPCASILGLYNNQSFVFLITCIYIVLTYFLVNRNLFHLFLVFYLLVLFKNVTLSIFFYYAFIFYTFGLKKNPFYIVKNSYKKILISLLVELQIIFLLYLQSSFNSFSNHDRNQFFHYLYFQITWLPFTLLGKHLMIRSILFFYHKLPLFFISFLREMHARHFFESPGGTWCFRHKILQDYFIQDYAKMEQERLLGNGKN